MVVCVGLEWMKSPNDAKIHSNCPDGESYKCPICSIKEEPDENTEKNCGDINDNSRSKKKILNVEEDEKNIFSFTVGETPKRFPEKSTKIPKVIIDRFDELDVIQNSDSDTIIADCNRMSDLSTHNNVHIGTPSDHLIEPDMTEKEMLEPIERILDCRHIPSSVAREESENEDVYINERNGVVDASQQTSSIDDEDTLDPEDSYDFQLNYENNNSTDMFDVKDYEESELISDMDDGEDCKPNQEKLDHNNVNDINYEDNFELTSEDCEHLDHITESYINTSDDEEAEPSIKPPVSHDTISRMMNCHNLSRKAFFTADIPLEAGFQISNEEWDRIKPTPLYPNKLQPSWTDIMAKHMRKSNDFCTFHFNRHYVNKQDTRKRNNTYVFKASGMCIFDDCSCCFNIIMKRNDFVNKLVTIEYQGSVKHANGDRHSRFIQNDDRKAMVDTFHKGPDKPSKVYQEIKENLSSNAKASGNRTGCGVNTSTIRKVASEGIQKSQMDKDVCTSLNKVRNSLTEQESERELPPNVVEGFVHMICLYPLIVYMWTEDQVRLWHELAAKDISYLDATGTIVGNHEGKRVLYYALVLGHPVEGNPPLPIAEMITSDHSATNIRAFLERLKRDESRVFNGRVTMPRQVNTDYSKAIILAVLRELNDETIEAFLNRSFRIVNKKADKQELTKMNPHIGCSHFMHIIHRNLMTISRAQRRVNNDEDTKDIKSEVWYRFNMYSVSLLVNSRTLNEFDSILKDVIVCLLSNHQNNMVRNAFHRIWERIHMEKNDMDINVSHIAVKIEPDLTNESDTPMAKNNPF